MKSRRHLFKPARHAPGTDGWVLLTCVWLVLTGNGAFWRAFVQDRDLASASTLGLLLATGMALMALHFVFIAPLANRWTLRPLLTAVILAAAVAGYFIDQFGVYLDSSMLRNALRTDVLEARELVAWTMLPHLVLHAALPLGLLWTLPRRAPAPLRPRRLLRRIATWLLIGAGGLGALWSVFQDASSTMRNHKEMRFLITPANLFWSLAVVLRDDSRAAARPRQVIGADARRAPDARPAGARPVRVLLVIGETARAANWGLTGYSRDTTPQLAARPDLVSFQSVTSCGTNTEVSLPCMFSPGGRRQYDEERIRGSQSLLHVLQRAGIQVFWRDNQSGCKGVCDGLPNEPVSAATAPAACDGARCLDEGLLQGLEERLRQQFGSATGLDQLVVLHQLGNHGPAYDSRYPAAFRRFLPVCATADLRRCSREQIVNAYDNALLYTDHVLARAIESLQTLSTSHDTALLYVSDHGESLGENGLYLHGMPYAIAPEVQTRVPMLLWLSPGFMQRQRVDLACVRARAAQPASHDHLFHTLLGMLAVETRLHERDWDLLAACRQ